MLKNTITIFTVIFVIFSLFNLFRQIQNAYTSGERLNEASNELQAMQDQNRALKIQLTQQTTPDFIEQEAREKLNLSRPNETLYIINPSLLSPFLDSSPSATPVPVPNWQGWLNLFGFKI